MNFRFSEDTVSKHKEETAEVSLWLPHRCAHTHTNNYIQHTYTKNQFIGTIMLRCGNRASEYITDTSITEGYN